MKKAELAFGIIFLAGVFLEFIPVIGSGILTVFGGLLLSLFYFIAGLWLFNCVRARDMFKSASYDKHPAWHVGLAIATDWALAVSVVAIQFRIMLWQGSEVKLLSGLIGMLVIFILALVLKLSKKEDFYSRILKRIYLFGTLNLLLFLLPEINLRQFYYRNQPGYKDIYEQSQAHPEDETLRLVLRQMERARREQ